MRLFCLEFTVYAPFSGSSRHPSRQPLLRHPLSSRFALHGLRAFEKRLKHPKTQHTRNHRELTVPRICVFGCVAFSGACCHPLRGEQRAPENATHPKTQILGAVWGFARGWFPKGWFWRMFPGPQNKNEGTKNGTTHLQAWNEGTKNGTTDPKKTGTRARSPKPPFYKNALLFPLGGQLAAISGVLRFRVLFVLLRSNSHSPEVQSSSEEKGVSRSMRAARSKMPESLGILDASPSPCILRAPRQLKPQALN